MSEEFPCCECCESDPYHPALHTIDCSTCDVYKFTLEEMRDHDREVAVKTLREAADEFMARLPDGTGNGRPYNSYTVARMLRARADQIEKEEDHD